MWLLDCCVSLATSAVSDSFADFNDSIARLSENFLDFSDSFADFNDPFSVARSASCAVNEWTVIAAFCAAYA